MELEHDCVSVPLEKFNELTQQKHNEGWTLIPGVQPVVVMHLVRVKGAQLGASPLVAGEHKAQVNVDDNRVFIKRGDKYIDKDGNEVHPSVVEGNGSAAS